LAGTLKLWRRVGPFVEPAMVAVAAAYVVAFAAMQLPSLFDPHWLEWDARANTMPAWRYHATGLFPNDFLVDFHGVMCTIGWRIVYWVGTLFTDPNQLSKLLPFVGLGVVVWQGWAFGRDRGGRAIGAATVILLVHCNYLWDRMLGANARAFGFPLVVMWIRYAAGGLERRALGTLFLQAICYPSVFVFCAPAHALTLQRRRGPMLRFALVAAVSSVVVLLAVRSVDPRIGHSVTYAELEKMGPQRELSALYPLQKAEVSVAHALKTSLYATYGSYIVFVQPWAERWAGVLMGVLLAGLSLLAGRRLSTLPRVFPALLLTSLVAFTAAQCVPYRLYFPDRMLLFSWPPLFLMALPLVAHEGLKRFTQHAAVAAAALVVTVQLVVCGSGLLPKLDLWDWSAGDTATVKFVAKLPKNVTVAAHFNTASAVQTFAHRQVLFSAISNIPHHYPFALELERRIGAYYRAYYARDLTPVRAMVATFGIDYLIVDTRDFGPDAKKRAQYLEPWTSLANSLIQRGPLDGCVFASPPAQAVVFRDGPTVIVDLHKL